MERTSRTTHKFRLAVAALRDSLLRNSAQVASLPDVPAPTVAADSATSATALRGLAHPLRTVESLLPPGSGRTVVVLANAATRGRLEAWLMPFTQDDVHLIAPEAVPEWSLDELNVRFHVGGTLDELSWQVRLVGAVDVLVNLIPTTVAEHNTIWQRLFYYLKPGGVYVVNTDGSEQGAFGSELTSWFRYISNAADPSVTPPASPRQREFASSTAVMQVSQDLVVLKKQRRHYVKLRDAHATRLLKLRDEGVAVTEMARLPPGDVVSRAQVTSHEAAVPIPHLDDRLHHPELFLRHYEGKIGFSGLTLMFSDYTILPDSFRHHLHANPVNPLTTNVSKTFARINEEAMPTETLRGHYYQVDSIWPGHFGHLTTEVFSKLWGWDEAKRAIPDLKCLLSTQPPHRDPLLEKRFFGAYGIAEEDVVAVDHPVYLESLVSASPLWHNQEPHYVHPQMLKIWDRLGAALIDWDVTPVDRIFVSRATNRRGCHNVDEVEAFFAARGFTVIYPEQLDLRQQAGLFAQASTVAGFGGSGLFNLMYAKKLQTLIVLNSEAYTARNEHLFTSLLGADVHYFWSTPDLPHPEGGWSRAAFHSPWTFDFERNQGPLEGVIDHLS